MPIKFKLYNFEMQELITLAFFILTMYFFCYIMIIYNIFRKDGKKMKRVFAFLMAFVFVLSSIPMIFSLGLSVNGFTYTVNNGEVEITDYTNNSTDVSVPSSIDGYPVTSIGAYAFADRLDNRGSDLNSITLPSTLKKIGEGAFTTNNKITSLTIPENVTEIGSRAFLCWMKLSNITFKGNNLKYIGKWAFRNCHSLSSIKFPNSLETIDEGAFSYCNSLTEVSFPMSVSSIGRSAFLGCTSLSKATILNKDAELGNNIFDLTATSSSDSSKRAMTIYAFDPSSAKNFASAENFSFVKLDNGSGGGDDPTGTDTSGEYFIRVSYSVTGKSSNGINANYAGFDKTNNDSAGFSVLYRDVNGTASTDKEQKFDIKSSLSSTGNYTVTANISGFPRLLYAYLDDDSIGSSACFKITKLEVGSTDTDLQTVWTGDMQVRSRVNPYAASVDWNNVIKKDYQGNDSNTFVNNSSGKFDKPYAKTFECSFEKQTMSFSNVTFISVNGFKYSAKDQYNVKMSNSLCTLSAKSSVSENNSYIEVKQGNESGCIVSIKNTAHLLTEDENKQTISVTASWAGVERTEAHTESFDIYDEKYEVIWFDANKKSIKNEQVYYGDKPEFPEIPTREADEEYHYSSPDWEPAEAQITDSISYFALYTAEEHDFDVIKDVVPSCTEGGEQDMVCKICDYNLHKDIDPLGHDFVAVVTEPTCTSQGYTTYNCSRCEESYVGLYTDMVDHEYELESKKAPTCTEKGVEVYACKNCDAKNTFEFDELGHNYSSTVTKPTCTHGGYITYTCSRCNDYYLGGFTDKLAHSFEYVDCAEPTCTKKGVEHYKCSVCGEDRNDYTEPLGHNFKSKRINDNALCHEADETQDATYYYTCTRCSAISEEDVFTVPMARITGKIDMEQQYKDITINLVKDGEVIASQQIAADSDGDFVFYSLEDGEYSLTICGESTTEIEIMTLTADSEAPVVLTESEDSAISLIELANGDINGDGVVDLADISAILASGVYGSENASGRPEDIDNNGVVNALDLSIILLSSNYASSSKAISAK